MSPVLLAALLALAPSAALTIDIEEVAAEKAPVVHVMLRATDGEGRPIAGLTAGDFALFEDGRPVDGITVLQTHPDAKPIALSLLMDTSGSMRPEDLSRAAAGVTGLADRLAPEDPFEIVAFNHDIRVLKSFDQALDRAALAALRPGGDTKLNDAVNGALDRLGTRAASERALIVLTDGVDDGSTMTNAALLQKATGAGVKIFAIGLGQVDAAQLAELTAATGGQFKQARDGSELAQIYQSIAAALMTEYRVTFTSTLAPGVHQLTIVLRTDGQAASKTIPFDLGAAGGAAQRPAGTGSGTRLVAAAIAVGLVLLLAALVAVLRRGALRRLPAAAAWSEPLPHGSRVQSYHLVGDGGVFPIAGRLVLGRDPFADLVVGHHSVSRSHAQLEECESGVLVQDLGSSNGTSINGQVVTASIAQPGDVIAFGDLAFELRAPTG